MNESQGETKDNYNNIECNIKSLQRLRAFCHVHELQNHRIPATGVDLPFQLNARPSTEVENDERMHVV